MASLNALTRTSQRKEMRVGRGGKRGKTSGRGTKGQNARAGRKKRPELRDLIKKLPKRRGFGKNRARGIISGKVLPQEVSLTAIDRAFDAGAIVTPRALVEKKVIPARGGKVPAVKILSGEATKKLTIEGCALSQGAKTALEKAGGEVK